MKKIKVYVAGKVSSDSVFGTHDWRDSFCAEIENKTGLEIINLDPTKGYGADSELDLADRQCVYGRDCFMIRMADLVIVNLTDDLSIGAAQEMLIAKYFKKPLIGIAARGGRFNLGKKELIGKVVQNYIHPFADVPCDALVSTVDEAADIIPKLLKKNYAPKGMDVVEEAIRYYEKECISKDKFVKNNL